MWLLLLESGVALFLLIFIVWWTMFSGTKPVQPPVENHALPEEEEKKKRKNETEREGG